MGSDIITPLRGYSSTNQPSGTQAAGKSAARTVIEPDPRNKLYFGVFLGDGKDISSAAIKSEEHKVGAKISYVVRFWCVPEMKGGFPLLEGTAAHQSGAVLFIKEMPGVWNNKTPRMLPEIIRDLRSGSGKHYEYYSSFASSAAAFGNPFFLSLGHEMNGDWYSWGKEGGGSIKAKSEYIEYFRLVHDLLLTKGATNTTFVFNPDAGQGDILAWFPGNQYVDWIGLDRFQSRSHLAWSGPEDLFGAATKSVKSLGLPMIVAEFGRNRKDLPWIFDEKKATITSVFDYVNSQGNTDGLSGISYFDMDKSDGKWGLTGKNLREIRASFIKHKDSIATEISTGTKLY